MLTKEVDNLLQPELVAMKILAVGHVSPTAGVCRVLIQAMFRYASVPPQKQILLTWTEPPEYTSLFICLVHCLLPSFSTEGHQSVHPHENKWLKKHKVTYVAAISKGCNRIREDAILNFKKRYFWKGLPYVFNNSIHMSVKERRDSFLGTGGILPLFNACHLTFSVEIESRACDF